MQLPDAAIGSIAAAIIAGLFVFVTSVLSKESKTSDFRQAWIDALREELAKFLSGTAEFSAAAHSAEGLDKAKEFLHANFELLHEIGVMEHRIILRLNPIKHASLIKKVRNYRKALISIHRHRGFGDNSEEDALTEALIDDAKTVLKAEWERVKAGEDIYKRTRLVALVVVALLALSSPMLLFRSVAETPDSKVVPAKISESSPSTQTGAGCNQSVQLIIDTQSQQPRGETRNFAPSPNRAQEPLPSAHRSRQEANCQTQNQAASAPL